MHVFYKPGHHDNLIYLDPAESHHCINVIRLRLGDEVNVLNGKGTLYETIISRADQKKVVLKIKSAHTEYDKKEYHLHIAIAPTKNMDRFEWFIEKSTEIGVDEITPLFCMNSERRKLRQDRLEKVLISAVKQSLKATLPVLNQPENFTDFIVKQTSAARFIAYCSIEKREHLLKVTKNSNNILVMIGPEGDFGPKEIKMAKETGFQPVSLGKSRLRTETAGVAVAQIIADSYVIKDFL